MRRSIHLRTASAVTLLTLPFAQYSTAAPAPATAYTPPPLAIYGQLPSLEDPVLSPAGDRLAVIERRGDQRYVVVIDLTKWQSLATARIGETKVRDLVWYDERQLLILYSTTSEPPFELTGDRQE